MEDEKHKKVLVVGDIHLKFNNLVKLCKKHKPDIVFQVGDFGYFPEDYYFNPKFLEKLPDTFFCDGNHENHERLRDGTVQEVLPSNVTFMERGSVININDKNVLFMGGSSSVDKNTRTPGFDWFPGETIRDTDLDRIPKGIRIDVVISHTCPEEFFNSLNSRYTKDNDPSRKALSYILNTCHPSEWFFGHFHKRIEGVYRNETKWICLNALDKSTLPSKQAIAWLR